MRDLGNNTARVQPCIRKIKKKGRVIGKRSGSRGGIGGQLWDCINSRPLEEGNRTVPTRVFQVHDGLFTSKGGGYVIFGTIVQGETVFSLEKKKTAWSERSMCGATRRTMVRKKGDKVASSGWG